MIKPFSQQASAIRQNQFDNEELNRYRETLPGFDDGVEVEGQQQTLDHLPFMDIYVCLQGSGIAHYRPLSITENMPLDLDVPPEYYDDVEKLAATLRKDFDGVEKGITYEGIRLRVSKLLTSSGEVWAAMRRVADLPPALDKLGFIPQLLPILREIGNREGLILMSGSTGQGKTTSISSLLLEYLNIYGGVAFSIEDPVEYYLEGRRGGTGYCYQSEIQDEAEWGLMLKRSLRWHPKYIFVGEIRTPDAANQLLRAATSGHTVLTTMHAGSMEEALEGLLQLGEVELGERAPLLLAAGLTAVIHQTRTPLGINARFMMTEPDNPGSPIRSLIREKRIGQTRTFSDQQMALLMREGKIFQNR